MLRLTKYLKNYKVECILGPFLKLLESVMELFLPLLMADIIDNGLTLGKEYFILRIVLMCLIVLFGYGFAFFCQRSAAKAGAGFGKTLRKELYYHINSLSYAELDTLGTTNLVTRLSSDVNNSQLAVSMFIRLVTRTPFITFGSLIMAFTINAKVALVFLAAIPLVSLVIFLVMRKSIPMHKKAMKKLDETQKLTAENLDGTRVVRAFAMEEHEEEKFEKNVSDFTKSAIKTNVISNLLTPLSSLIMYFALLFIIFISAKLVNAGDFLAGQITALTTYALQILLALTVFANLAITFIKAESSASRICEVLNTKPTVTDKEDAISDIDNLQNSLEFKDVCFKYSTSSGATLKNISFSLESNKTLGIIGVTGSGKSTLCNLIPRFYKLSSGEILLGGKNVEDISLNALRKYISIAPQKAVAFNMSIMDNIKFGSEINDDDVLLASECACVNEIVERKKMGFDEQITENGKNLSGGQKQRISLARAICRKPKLLIIDDSLSALDTSTEKAVLNNLKKNYPQTTKIIVSQRVNTIKNADKILLLDRGEMVAVGTHEELLRSSKEYREIVLSQNLSLEEENL